MKAIFSRRCFLLALVGGGFAVQCAATDDVQVQFLTTLVSGTCQAQLKSGSGSVLSGGSLAFGNVYLRELQQGTSYQNFSVTFSHCDGVTSATIQTAPGGNGLCNAATFMGAGDVTNAAAELREGSDGSGSQINCNDQRSSVQTVNPNMNPEISYSARLVIAPGKSSADLKSGSFVAPVTFTVDYQ